ncbi:hypothetical protein H0H87_003427 [Tephrocybe sp. NHM501043]|nr:hypothetical protein H0H87_003427 [Tephrocybe sp. NHM501043]
MSRRESRVSMGARHNDALFEFENCGVRIEELNAQISSLHVENLRLRASEIALAAQLKREREKSRRVMAEAEAATIGLTKQLGQLRLSFNISSMAPLPSLPPPPRAQKPPSTVNTEPASSPHGNRISRPPNVPGIYEDDEPSSPLTSENDREMPPSPVLRKTKTKPRLSASRLPLPSRMASPPPLLPQANGVFRTEFEPTPISKPRKPSRRQSGLLSVSNEALSVPRAASPAFGSPIRRAAGLAEEEEEMAAVSGQLVDIENDEDVEPKPPPRKRKSRGKEQGAEEAEMVAEGSKPRERKRKEHVEGETDGGGKPRLQDVTNPRAALVSIDNTGAPSDFMVMREELTAARPVPALSAGRAFLTTSPTSSAPTSRGSSSPAPPGEGDGTTGVRERRARKSVNYAEPKLNTKMRKPDPPPGTAPPPKKRSSAAAILGTYRLPEDGGNDADNDTEARSSLELPLVTLMNGAAINPESFPLPPSRPASAASLFSPPPPPRLSMKRKKSRPVLDDDESDGAQADAEFGLGGMNTWVNVDARRRAAGGSGSNGSKRSTGTLDDPRRHSMAI